MNLTDTVSSLDWASIAHDLNQQGYSTIGPVLSADTCKELAAHYERPSQFRSRVVMARHGFGRGEYQYYDDPLPPVVQSLRNSLYPSLAAIASQWNEAMGNPVLYPPEHPQFRELCRQAGQTRPTPLLLRYRQGDYNCLHQDLYGELFFPIQAAFLLSEPGRDFTGGELVFTEQRPRMQSRVSVAPLRQGEGVLFAVHQRPQQGARGFYRVTMRHGVSVVRSGERFTLGVIFHDAR